LKRKIRNYVRVCKSDAPPFDIYVKERGILANEQKKAYIGLGVTEGSDRPNEQARAWMCKNYYDIRTFGAVMTTGKAPLEAEGEDVKKKDKKLRQWNCGQVRGPVQFAFSRSIDPIFSTSHAITRVALTNPGDTGRESTTTDDEGGEEKAATGQMGRKHTVAYGLYRGHAFLSPFLAKDTKFTNGDFLLLIDALKGMFEIDRSASRGEMSAQALFAFEHSSELGNAPSHKLFEKIGIANDPTARQFSSARVAAPADGEEVAAGVRCWRLLQYGSSCIPKQNYFPYRAYSISRFASGSGPSFILSSPGKRIA
jgi:CRISPR-associated protein Csd2